MSAAAAAGGGSRGPSVHLTWDELACHDGTPYPVRWRGTRAILLAAAFEAVRAEVGGWPLLVTSGYRTERWNRRIGGAANSQHVQGRAVDLVPVKGLDVVVLALAAASVRRRRTTALCGIGVYPEFLHLDVRPRSGAVWPTWGRDLATVERIRHEDREARGATEDER